MEYIAFKVMYKFYIYEYYHYKYFVIILYFIRQEITFRYWTKKGDTIFKLNFNK